MISGSAWVYFIFVNLGFLLNYLLMFYFVMKSEIKKNWNEYRCNPMYMPLSDNVSQDFTFCVQKIQSSYMDHLLQPLTSVTSSLTQYGGALGDGLNDANIMISNVRTYMTKLATDMFGGFFNLITEFQRTSINIKDLAGKIIGIATTALYVIDGSQKTMVSMWNGPPGQIVRTIGSMGAGTATSAMCFHPDTKVVLQNGHVVSMKDLELGSILENGSCVEAVMKIFNKHNEPFYKLTNFSTKYDDIYVTGSHLVKFGDKYIPVKDHPCAGLQSPDKTLKTLSCLITSDNKIAIGNYTFWDWEDDNIKEQQSHL